MMNQHISDELLVDLISDTISPDQEEAIFKHLSFCDDCKKKVNLLLDVDECLLDYGKRQNGASHPSSPPTLPRVLLTKDGRPYKIAPNTLSWAPQKEGEEIEITVQGAGFFRVIFREEIAMVEVSTGALASDTGGSQDSESLSEPSKLFSVRLKEGNEEGEIRICMKAERGSLDIDPDFSSDEDLVQSEGTDTRSLILQEIEIRKDKRTLSISLEDVEWDKDKEEGRELHISVHGAGLYEVAFRDQLETIEFIQSDFGEGEFLLAASEPTEGQKHFTLTKQIGYVNIHRHKVLPRLCLCFPRSILKDH